MVWRIDVLQKSTILDGDYERVYTSALSQTLVASSLALCKVYEEFVGGCKVLLVPGSIEIHAGMKL